MKKRRKRTDTFGCSSLAVDLIKIENVFDHHHVIPTVIDWIQQEWQKDKPLNKTEIEHRLCGDRLPNRLPIALIALHGLVPVGYVSLIQYETSEYKNKLFWVDGLYVVPINRGIGLGSRLLQAATERAAYLRLPYLCAYTDKIDLYTRAGWRPLTPFDLSHAGPIVLEKPIK